MMDRIIFLKERLGFLIDHIELFLENYNQLTTQIFTDYKLNQFDFHYISSENMVAWEQFRIDSNRYHILSNDTKHLVGLVKGKTYIIPPFLKRDQIEKMIYKLNRYQYGMMMNIDHIDQDIAEKITAELADHEINLSVLIDDEMVILPFERVCRIIIEYRDFKKLDTNLGSSYKSKVEMELSLLATMIKQSETVLH